MEIGLVLLLGKVMCICLVRFFVVGNNDRWGDMWLEVFVLIIYLFNILNLLLWYDKIVELVIILVKFIEEFLVKLIEGFWV